MAGRKRLLAVARVFIGTSGWVYRHWRGVFYPATVPQRAWLDHYAGRFSTVELNATFYRVPTVETVAHWRDGVPEGFVFAVKANRRITHLKRLQVSAAELGAFLDVIRGFGERLGAVLFQLPPNMKCDLARLDAFAGRLPPELLSVLEFRHQSWFTDEVRACLERHALVHCVHDHAGMRVPDWQTGRAAYFRFHGDPDAPLGSYRAAALRRRAARMAEIAGGGRNVYAYFNNDAHGSAVRDAARLRSLLPRALRDGRGVGDARARSAG